MKATIFNTEGKELGSLNLPKQFDEDYRPEVIKRAVLTIESNNRQPYGADPMAGKRASAKISRRRRDYKSGYGKGISRVPRKTLSHRGGQMQWAGAYAPGTVKGRKAHPPKAEKIWKKKINKKENRMAIRSALHAAADKECVIARGHQIPEKYPIILDNSFEKLTKTKEVRVSLEKIGFGKELARIADKQIRAGRGKMRGRKYKRKTGPLIVINDNCPLRDSAKNLGIDIIIVKNLNAKDLAPGTLPGRLTLFTQSAIERMKTENLFV